MKENLAIASMIDAKEPGIAYDNYCKKILSNKQILAHIIKEYVNEFADIPLEEIPQYIDLTPQENVVLNGTMEGKNTEDETIPGAMIRYDVLLEAYLSRKKEAGDEEQISLLIDIEAQNKHDPGYPLIRRALYYCFRLLDRQKNASNGFKGSDYGNLKKVYSIWLCFQNPTKNDDEVVNLYSINEACLKTEWRIPKEAYDLINAFLIYPKKEYDYEDDKHSVLEMMNILYISELSAEHKKSLLSQNYGIIMTEEIDKEVTGMCNLSQGLLEKGEARGEARGVAKGVAKGKAEERLFATLDYVKSLIKKKNFSVDEAMDLLDVDNDIRPKILEELKKQSEPK